MRVLFCAVLLLSGCQTAAQAPFDLQSARIDIVGGGILMPDNEGMAMISCEEYNLISGTHEQCDAKILSMQELADLINLGY